MKFSLICGVVVAFSFAGALAFSQELDKPKDPVPPKLSAEDKAKLRDILADVQKLTAEKHYFEALQKANDAEALLPNSALVWNVRGSVYTACRDFDKARDAFTKARDAMPKAFEPQFNLAELHYVEQKYPEAEEAFQKILKDFPKLRENVRHLTLFKIMISRLKQGKTAEAQEIQKSFTDMDDTPAYFFAKAAVSFNEGKGPDALSWIAKAERIFQREQNSVYIDTLEEARWIPSMNVPDGPSKAADGAGEKKQE